jgi:phosphoenolpyruvate phosphomutase
MVGIHDINVVVGYKGDKVNIEGAKILKNPDFKNNGIMYSIIKGLDSIADKNIVLYSDIILDGDLLQKLLKREGDIIIVVDGTYKKTHFRNKKLELVITKYNTSNSRRVIDIDRKNPVLKIGTGLKEEEAHFEFIGVALLSRKGMEIILKECEKPGISKSSSFADFIQYLIDKGYEVLAFEVNSGWMEIHSFADYKRARSIFSSINP